MTAEALWAVVAVASVVGVVFLGTDRLWKRAVVVAAVAACTAVVTGALAAVVPGDPVAAVLGEDAPDEARAALAREMGLDGSVPALVRPLHAGGRVLTGLLSTTNPLSSWRTKTPVRTLIALRLPKTLGLGAAAVAVGVVVGVALGVAAASSTTSPPVAALRRSATLPTVARGRAVGRGSFTKGFTRRSAGFVVSAIIALLAAVPRFVLGPALVVVVAIGWKLLPAGGGDGAASWVLPVLTLALPFAGVVARHVRGAVEEALASPFARTARARGTGGLVVVVRHALPHALLPVVHLTALQAGAVASGAVVVEKVFSWPGLGSLLQEGLRTGDVPVVQGVVVVAAVAIAVAGLAADAAAAVVDPRLRRRSAA